MYLNSATIFDLWPLHFELVHHFFPDKERLVRQFLDFILGLFLEKIKTESSLNLGSLFHQEE
jgi:hypothetical protein